MDTTTTREEYLEKMKKQLDAWNAEIDKFEAKGQEMSGEAKEKYNNQVKELRTQLDSMKAKVQEMSDKGQEKWSAMTSELNHIKDTFVHSFNYFQSQL